MCPFSSSELDPNCSFCITVQSNQDLSDIHKEEAKAVPDRHEGDSQEEAEGAAELRHQGGEGVDQHLEEGGGRRE